MFDLLHCGSFSVRIGRPKKPTTTRARVGIHPQCYALHNQKVDMTDETQNTNENQSRSSDNSKQQNRGNIQRPKGQSARPLSDAEINEVAEMLQRVPGLGRIVLSLVRNRSARVFVPETALGKEMLDIVSELDRISSRATNVLTRNLSAEHMTTKAQFDLRMVELINPLAKLTAEMANKYDNPQNSILRHAETKRMLREIRAEAQDKKAKLAEDSQKSVAPQDSIAA